MREIKFRAWDNEKNKMDYKPYFHEFEDINTQFEDMDFILMQFTGLHDKNGKEIYEGDIVCNEGFKEEVKWNEFYGWVVSDEQMLGEVNFARIEVIGNIYENKELLDEVQK